MAKSQWSTITRGAMPTRHPATGYTDNSVAHRRVSLDSLNKKTLRPNGEYMTELEWATYIMGKRTRARKVCPCPGKCECHIPSADRVTPKLQEVKVPAATVYTLKRK